jgi:hypothetical protein
MTYITYSEYSPESGGVSPSLYKNIPGNPVHPTSEASFFPSYYNQFANKTNINYSQYIAITDELHKVSEVFATPASSYPGYMYVNHRILRNSSVTVTNGIVATGAIDYDNGIIYFSTNPVTDFTITYIASPDAYFGDHINAVQNAIMTLERTVGGPTGGLRNAVFWLHSGDSNLPNAINMSAIPANTTTYIKSGPGISNTVTIGNGGDKLNLDIKELRITNTDPSFAISGRIGDSKEDKFFLNGLLHIEPTGGLISTDIGTGVVFAVGNPLQSMNTGFLKPSLVPGPYPLPIETGIVGRFFGDIQVIGNVYVSGGTVSVTTNNTAVNSFTNQVVMSSGLYVSGNSILGANTTTTTTANGSLTVGRWAHIKGLGSDVSRIDTAIDVRNAGNINNGLGGPYSDSQVSRGTEAWPDLPFYVGTNLRSSPGPFTDLTVNKNFTVDGLDPSYIAKLLRRRAFDRHDFRPNMLNDCVRDGLYGSVTASVGAGTSTWHDTGLFFDISATGLPFTTATGHGKNLVTTDNYFGSYGIRWFHLGGNYYHGKFQNQTGTVVSGEFTGSYHYGNGNEWRVKWTKDDTAGNLNPGAFKYGADIPLSSMQLYYTGVSPWIPTGGLVTISRPFNTPVSVGDTYTIYHPKHSKGNCVRAGVDIGTADIHASNIDPIVVNINGIHKVITSPCVHDLTALGSNPQTVFFYAELDTPEIARQGLTPGALLETEAKVTYDIELKETDTRVAIGEIKYDGTDVVDFSHITYAPNGCHDTLWFRTLPTGSLMNNGVGEFSWFHRSTGNSGTGRPSAYTGAYATPYFLAPTAPAYLNNSTKHPYNTYIGDTLVDNTRQYRVRVNHNIGVWSRLNSTNTKVYVAPDLGKDQPFAVSGGTTVLREGPDYGYIKELHPVKFINGAAAATAYPCYEIIHQDRLYTDIVLYNIGQVPGGIVAASGSSGARNLALTGVVGDTDLTGAGVADRDRSWWWTRVVIE